MSVRAPQAWGRRALREAHEERRDRELDDAEDAHHTRPSQATAERLALARAGEWDGPDAA